MRERESFLHCPRGITALSAEQGLVGHLAEHKTQRERRAPERRAADAARGRELA